jgi:parvulin-like peptidyl-prolyl isomerase
MKSSITLAAFFLVGASPLAAQSTPTADGIIARIGDLQVSASDVKASLAALGAKDGTAIRNDPALLNQVVRSLLVQRILLREAEAGGHDKKPEVAAQLARAREVALTESYLQSIATPPETYPNETELKASYEAARPSIGVPKSWRLAQIFISLPKDADKAAADKAQARLDAVQKALKSSPADFAKLASAHSEEQASASRGGEIGWLAETQIQPGIREKLGSLKTDAISDPIRLDDGWHIVKVLDAREPYTPTLEQIRSQLVTQLRAEKTRENSQAYLAKLLQENPLAINELALDQIAEAQPK